MTETQKQIALIEPRFSNDPNVNKVITEIKHGSRRHSEIFGTLFFDWPSAQELIKKLIAHISDLIPGESIKDEPVIFKIITEALEKYADLVYCSEELKHQDAKRIYGFIEALFQGVEAHVNIAVTDGHGNEWTVLSEEGLYEWKQRLNKNTEIAIKSSKKIDVSSIRIHLFNLVACEYIKQLMRKSGYEKALVDGRLTSSL